MGRVLKDLSTVQLTCVTILGRPVGFFRVALLRLSALLLACFRNARYENGVGKLTDRV